DSLSAEKNKFRDHEIQTNTSKEIKAIIRLKAPPVQLHCRHIWQIRVSKRHLRDQTVEEQEPPHNGERGNQLSQPTNAHLRSRPPRGEELKSSDGQRECQHVLSRGDCQDKRKAAKDIL